MRSICLALLFIGCTHAAMQQVRSPVYSSQKPVPTTKQPDIIPPVPTIHTQTPLVAQAREGTGSLADTSPQVSQAPNQNYLVYYYSPEQYRTGGAQTPAVGVQPYDNQPSIFNRIPWRDVGFIVLSLVFVGAGGAVLYNGVGTQVKARAMRELQGLDIDDASQMARRVLRAIEKFQNMNVENQ